MAPVAPLIRRLESIAQMWEDRARTAHPADAMLINKHARELRAAIAAATQPAAAPCDGILRGNADLVPAAHATLGQPT